MVVTGTIVDVTTVALVLSEKDVEERPSVTMVETGVLMTERLVTVVVTGVVKSLLDVRSAACCFAWEMLGESVGDGSGADRRHPTRL